MKNNLKHELRNQRNICFDFKLPTENNIGYQLFDYEMNNIE